MGKVVRLIGRFLIFSLLTILTQIGGVVYLISYYFARKQSKIKRFFIFSGVYLFVNLLIIPNVASFFFGREPIKESEFVKAHSFIYKLCNRNYVHPELNSAISSIGKNLYEKHKIKLIYLDANFPFIDKFPLLPHISHNDGKKVDVSLIYSENGTISDKKPSVSGYGVFEHPKKNTTDYCSICKKKGYWQYDLTKYTTFGRINKNITFSDNGTRTLVNEIVKHKSVGKLLIEPHLKQRLHLTNQKVRFHGCHAVRHDDHIHFQLE